LEAATSLWRLMQRIETCRHRADLAEAKALTGSATFRQDMADCAKQWRMLALQIEWLDQVAERPQAGPAKPRRVVDAPRPAADHRARRRGFRP
jgi:hypothetical protein